MHCYLYHRLFNGGLMNALYPTAEGHQTILLHKEYPTVARYDRGEDKKLVASATGRRRGAFDISIWDPSYIASREHRKQKVLCAAELALDELAPGQAHTINDATKLAGPENEIKNGYLLFFVRDRAKYERMHDEVWRELKNAAERVRVVFAEARAGGDTPPPARFLGDWGIPLSDALEPCVVCGERHGRKRIVAAT
jgi:hypothetical protein